MSIEYIYLAYNYIPFENFRILKLYYYQLHYFYITNISLYVGLHTRTYIHRNLVHMQS